MRNIINARTTRHKPIFPQKDVLPNLDISPWIRIENVKLIEEELDRRIHTACQSKHLLGDIGVTSSLLEVAVGHVLVVYIPLQHPEQKQNKQTTNTCRVEPRTTCSKSYPPTRNLRSEYGHSTLRKRGGGAAQNDLNCSAVPINIITTLVHNVGLSKWSYFWGGFTVCISRLLPELYPHC